MVNTQNLTPEQKIHVDVMLAIAKSVADTPMVLKGGTALLLIYQLDRFSEDLDFDSSKKMRLESRIQEAVSTYVKVKSIDLLKDTDTVSRYRLVYETPCGIRVYPIQTLIQQKLNALENRTRARDLYDVSFLARKYPNLFTNSGLVRLQGILKDLDALERRFMPDFEEDSILGKEDVAKLVISLQESSKQIEAALSSVNIKR
jgi:predicted nucleotidyltransferase component of viral defense system